MTPYIKQIVELHKIHKAIENCKGGGDVTPEPTPEPSPSKTGLINCFPYYTKVVGFIENDDNRQGINYNSSSRTATLKGDRHIIPIEEIEEYVLNKETQYSSEYGFSPVIEYDELAFEDDFNGHDQGIANWTFYLGGVEDNKRYILINAPSDYLMSGKAMKLTIEGKDYIVFAVLSD